MKIKNKYKHEKQQDGTYNIYNIPIFKLYDDKKRGKIDKNTAKDIINNFNNDAKRGYYPRVHVGHQDFTVHNRPGLGFMDNLRFDGVDCFFCDIAKIHKKDINAVKNLKYPYRSVEYDTQEKKITGLAMLESIPPYFTFPILALNETEKFSKLESKNLIVLFQEKESDMDEQVKAPVGEKVAQEEVKVETLTSEDIAGIRELLDLTPIILEMVESFKSSKSDKEVVSSVASTPEVVAMSKQYNELKSRLDIFEAKNHNITVFSRLRDICNQNANVDYKSEAVFISKLEGDENKNLYISKLESRSEIPEPHRASQFARNFKGFDDKTLDKYSKESAEIKKIANQAYKDYNDTINQHNEKRALQFSRSFPTVEKYVDYVVSVSEFEEYNPNKG